TLRVAHHDHIIRNIAKYNSTGSDGYVLADSYTLFDDCIGTYKGISTHFYISAEYCPGTHMCKVLNNTFMINTAGGVADYSFAQGNHRVDGSIGRNHSAIVHFYRSRNNCTGVNSVNGIAQMVKQRVIYFTADSIMSDT